MNYVESWWITEVMMKDGGVFVKGLGMLWRETDAINRIKLEMCFKNYFNDDDYCKKGRELHLKEIKSFKGGSNE